MRSRSPLLLVVLVLAAGCRPELPDPESPGARFYAARCGGCHDLYAPGVMTAAMWEIMVQRMQQEMLRRHVPTLDAREQEVLLAYLAAHATDAPATAGRGEEAR